MANYLSFKLQEVILQWPYLNKIQEGWAKINKKEVMPDQL